MLVSLLPYLLAFAFLAMVMHMGTSPPAAVAAAPQQTKPILPTVGRVVLFVIPNGKSKGRVVPAIVVRVWGPECVNLAVLLDGTNDAEALRPAATPAAAQKIVVLVDWATSATLDPAGTRLGSWHWMPFQLGQAKKEPELAQAAAQIIALGDVVADLSRRLAALEGPATAKHPLTASEPHGHAAAPTAADNTPIMGQPIAPIAVDDPPPAG